MTPIGHFTIPDGLRQLSKPKVDALLDFATSCSEDPNTRTIAVTTLALTLWQLAGANTARTFPSLLLINSSPDQPSLGAQVSNTLLNLNGDTTPRVQKDGPFAYGTIEDAPTKMAASVHHFHHSAKHTQGVVGKKSFQHFRDDYYAAQKTAFGYGRSRPYADSWSEHFGLISDRDDIVTLRLATDRDIALFQHHLGDGKTLCPPKGIGGPLSMVPKRIALAGALAPEQWDFATASHLLELGLPVIALPDLGKGSLPASSWPPVEFLASMWPQAQPSQIGPAVQFSTNTESNRRYQRLRRRLHHLPANYEYTILTLARELISMCYSLVSLAASHSPKESQPKIGEAIQKLHDETLRGITLGVESLTWHGLGVSTSHPPKLVTKTLQVVREKGSLSLRDLQRTARISTATTRDEILAALEDAGVIRVKDKIATAATFSEFSHELLSRTR